ncbi:hypothetical protein H6G41_10290 [Tolypothrix sp. FACHB-123]|uniref:hypothetical protein n=1 Tax=Tolypothrix sp. FACHB-123 TaxID=2692868 RepID=UPI001682C36C|nr:hypothetical protein [Tolypothrix sp. FACHB-123]MBD2355007.1 hypothetical protein [Tolypothrix sp. FACHB-123]
MTHDYANKDIESLVIGKWQYEYEGFSYYEEYKKDFTYEITVKGQNLITMSALGILGSKFTGRWYLKDRTLHLRHKRQPNSSLSSDFLSFKTPFADIFHKIPLLPNIDKREIFSIDKKHMSIQVKRNSYIIIFRES